MITAMFLETSLRIGGTENVLTQLMERLDRSQVRPLLCCLYEPGELGDRLIKAGHAIDHHLAKSRWDLGLPIRLFRLFRKEKVDVLFLVNQPLIQFWGTWCGILAGVPVRITAIRSTGKINRIQRRLFINQLTFPWINCVTALSQTHKSYLVEKEKIDPRKIEIIPNGVDFSRFNRQEGGDLLRASLGVPREAKVAGIVAMLRPEKAHDIFLKAAAKVVKGTPEAYFLIVGDGVERSRLESLSAELGIAKNVRFLGARDDIPEILKALDVGVLSSNPVVETLSNSVLEYMAAGKPVVATRVGTLPEVIVEGQTGFLVEPGDWSGLADRMTKLFQDPSLAERMGRAGRQRVEKHYSVDQMVRMTEALFERLLNHAGKV